LAAWCGQREGKELVLRGTKQYIAGAFLSGAMVLGGAAMPAIASAAPPVTQTAQQANFGNLISALNNINAQIGNLNVLTNNLNGSLNGSNIQLVNVNDVLNGNNVNALNNALNRNNVQIGVLQNFLNNVTVNDVLSHNTVSLSNFLNNNTVPVTIGQVVGVNVLSGGQVVLFYLPA
jgi:hypothetical protein